MYRVKYWQTALAILAVLSASLAFGEDFKTINGKEYKDGTVAHVETDGIVLKTKTGISKVYLQNCRKRFRSGFFLVLRRSAQHSAG
jgi:hypothetical protein